MTLHQRSGFVVLVLLIIIIECLIHYVSFDAEDRGDVFTKEEIAILNSSKDKIDDVKSDVELFDFNPNNLDEDGFVKLGFSRKQAKSIIKYRYILGGNFSTVDEFGDSYVVSDKKLEELRPYIKLKKIEKEKEVSFNKSNKKNSLKSFDLNKQGVDDFIKLGFSEKQAKSILNFKNSLPNKEFESKEQFKKCYVVNDYMYGKLSQFIKINNHKNTFLEENFEDKNIFYVNRMEVEDWVEIGVESSLASNIIKYKDFIGGFKTVEEVKKCKYIEEKIYENIREYINFAN